MSARPATFYAIACDFPDCGEIYDGSEFTYWQDPYYETDGAHEDGWIIGPSTGVDYCPQHVVEMPCPTPDECEWCEDHYGVHLTPMEDTVENRLAVIRARVLRTADSKFTMLEHRMTEALSPRGAYGRRVGASLQKIHEDTCRRWQPDITIQELYQLQQGARVAHV